MLFEHFLSQKRFDFYFDRVRLTTPKFKTFRCQQGLAQHATSNNLNIATIVSKLKETKCVIRKKKLLKGKIKTN